MVTPLPRRGGSFGVGAVGPLAATTVLFAPDAIRVPDQTSGRLRLRRCGVAMRFKRRVDGVNQLSCGDGDSTQRRQRRGGDMLSGVVGRCESNQAPGN